MISLGFFLVGLTSFGLILCLYLKLRSNSSLPLPPGPKKLPLIGNLLDLPKRPEWEIFQNWSKQYDSDIIHLNIVGTSIIILNTTEVAADLLEKRSTIYSSRPRMPMVNELMGWGWNFALMQYGEAWRSQRRLFHQEFHGVASQRYRPRQLKAAHDLLRRLLTTPGDFIAHFRHTQGAIIMAIAYGIEVLPSNDPYIEIAEKGVKPLTDAAVPGAFLVDQIPLLKYVPAWFPGASFKRKAKEWRKWTEAMVEVPFGVAKRNIENGVATPSFVSYSLQKLDESRDAAHQELLIQATAAAMFTGGSDTTVATLTAFIVAVLLNPEAQKKAQQEIDSVIGHDQLPDFDDEGSLPYVTALVMESFRWRDVGPMSVPRCTVAEDVYRGYRIPAGSIVITNSWSMLHDENRYPDPFSFKPERFLKDGKLNPDVKDPTTILFGMGRRICPGRFLAMSSMWIQAATILATFDITKAISEDGSVIEPLFEYPSSSLLVMPLPFKCSIKPRSRKAIDLIQSTLE